MCMKKFMTFVCADSTEIFFSKLRSAGLRQLFPYMAFVFALIVPLWADSQLLMEQFDTMPIQCRHIEHMREGFWFRKNNF